MATALELEPTRAASAPRISARFLLREAAGALGDLGTFVPLAVGMVQIAGLDAGTLLVTAGLVNIWGGLAFRIPIAVQPMKAICALAIAGALSGTQAVVAGLCVGVSMLVLGLFGLVRQFARIVPGAVLRGLQLTVAVELLLRGFQRAFAGVSTGAVFTPQGVVPLLWRRPRCCRCGCCAAGWNGPDRASRGGAGAGRLASAVVAA